MKIKKKPIKIKFEEIVSPEKLMLAWYNIKNNSDNLKQKTLKKILTKIEDSWFIKTSKQLIKNDFKYPLHKFISTVKFKVKKNKNFIVIVNPKIKIIEKAILNCIEPYFEGIWSWYEISKQEYKKLKNILKIPNNELKFNTKGYFVKYWFHKPIFDSTNYGFCFNKSWHKALFSIKYWKSNIVWILNYNVCKVFDNINYNKLENIFKLHIDCPKLWNEIVKMLNVNKFNSCLFFKKRLKESNFFCFFFNIYMNEFDNFVKKLSNSFFNYKIFSKINQEYEYVEKVFFFKNIINNVKKFESTKNFIYYVRYVDNFIIGIESCKKFAEEIRNKIDFFLKNNLYLIIKKNKLVNKNNGAIKFLGFFIYLSKFYRKVKVKWNKFISIAKYRKRVKARLAKADAKLAKAAVYSIKKNMLRAFRKKLEIKNKKFNTRDIPSITYNIADELIQKSNQENPALYRWENHYANLFKIEQSLALGIYHKQILSLNIPKEVEQNYYIKLKLLKDKFIEDIEKIESDVKKSFKLKVEKNNLKQIDISKETISTSTKVFSEEFLNQKQLWKIVINAPLHIILEKLILNRFYHSKKTKPIGNPLLSNFSDIEIIKHYSNLMNGILKRYWLADNFNRVKNIVEGLRKSCALTLSIKHKKTIRWVYNTYGVDIELKLDNIVFSLPTIKTLVNMNPKVLIKKNLF